MTDYLLIECVINNLVQSGIIVPPHESWKNTVIGTQYYDAYFFHADSGQLLFFRVSVVDGVHKITANALKNHARFFRMNLAKILDECKL